MATDRETTIVLEALTAANACLIEVGTGISPSQLEHLAEPLVDDLKLRGWSPTQE